MRIFGMRRLFFVVTAILVGNCACLLAQEPCSPRTADDVALMSDALKKATIQDLYRRAYLTSDLLYRIQCYDAILSIDASDANAKTELEKAKQQMDAEADQAQKEQAKQALLQRANAALASENEQAFSKALSDIDEAIKANPNDKELSDIRQRLKTRLDRRRVSQQVRDAITAGHDAYFAEDSVQLVPALRALDDALKVDPTNAEVQSWKQKIESRIRTERFVWWLKVISLVAAIVGVIGVALYLLLRKRQGLLEFADGDRMGEIFPLDKPKTKIGALSEGNDLVLSDARGKISRFHCEIFHEGRRYFIKDGSTNGTWLNEEYLETGRPRLLRKGDRLTLAGEVTLIFRLK